MIICNQCGQAYDIGDYPFCKGGHGRAYPAVIDDQLEGGPRRFETMGDDAPYIETKSQWKREMAARHLECVGDRKPASYFKAVFKRHDEELRDTGRNREY